MNVIGMWMLLGGLGVGVYAYLVYPGLLWVAACLRPSRRPVPPPDELPLVSIVLPAYNEESAIRPALNAVLGLDYPADRMQVLVVSDASTDRTDEIVRSEYGSRGVDLLRLPRRAGKTAAENAAREHLRGSIVVNTDASVRVHPDSLKRLVAEFADPDVGVASARDVSVAADARSMNPGESGYVGYEMWVRELETHVGGIVGASGCYYANRAELHQALVPEALSRDFAAALIARERGFRSVSVKEALCYVPRASSLRREYVRKVRTMARGLETLYFKRALLNPFRYGTFAWMLLSHKLCRWLAPWGNLVALAGLVGLAPHASWARWLLVGTVVLLTLGGVGWWRTADRRGPRLLAVPAFLVAGHVAAYAAWLTALRGELNPIWEPTRRDPTPIP